MFYITVRDVEEINLKEYPFKTKKALNIRAFSLIPLQILSRFPEK